MYLLPVVIKNQVYRLCSFTTNWWTFLFYSPYLLFSSSFNSWDMPLILIFFICNKADDAFGTIKLLIKKRKTNHGNDSLFTFGANCSSGLHCLPALVYLLVWPSISHCSFIGFQFVFTEVAHTSVALALLNTDVGICILLLTSLLRYWEQYLS